MSVIEILLIMFFLAIAICIGVAVQLCLSVILDKCIFWGTLKTGRRQIRKLPASTDQTGDGLWET